MGYATTLYAVDLGRLKSAISSRNARLLKRFQKGSKIRAALAKRESRTPRLKIMRNSDLFLNGEKLSMEQVVAELQKRKWRGRILKMYFEPGRMRGQWSNLDKFWMALGRAEHLAGTEMYAAGEGAEESFLGDSADEEISEDQAAVELLTGRITKPEDAHQYGYALERLCDALGSRLATIEGRRGILSHLGLNTRLCKERSPVRLPERDDFPAISFLTADELQREVKQFGALDLSFPKSREIERDRQQFFKCLKQAARKGGGVVAFYY